MYLLYGTHFTREKLKLSKIFALRMCLKSWMHTYNVHSPVVLHTCCDNMYEELLMNAHVPTLSSRYSSKHESSSQIVNKQTHFPDAPIIPLKPL